MLETVINKKNIQSDSDYPPLTNEIIQNILTNNKPKSLETVLKENEHKNQDEIECMLRSLLDIVNDRDTIYNILEIYSQNKITGFYRLSKLRAELGDLKTVHLIQNKLIKKDLLERIEGITSICYQTFINNLEILQKEKYDISFDDITKIYNEIEDYKIYTPLYWKNLIRTKQLSPEKLEYLRNLPQNEMTNISKYYHLLYLLICDNNDFKKNYYKFINHINYWYNKNNDEISLTKKSLESHNLSYDLGYGTNIKNMTLIAKFFMAIYYANKENNEKKSIKLIDEIIKSENPNYFNPILIHALEFKADYLHYKGNTKGALKELIKTMKYCSFEEDADYVVLDQIKLSDSWINNRTNLMHSIKEYSIKNKIDLSKIIREILNETNCFEDKLDSLMLQLYYYNSDNTDEIYKDVLNVINEKIPPNILLELNKKTTNRVFTFNLNSKYINNALFIKALNEENNKNGMDNLEEEYYITKYIYNLIKDSTGEVRTSKPIGIIKDGSKNYLLLEYALNKDISDEKELHIEIGNRLKTLILIHSIGTANLIEKKGLIPHNGKLWNTNIGTQIKIENTIIDLEKFNYFTVLNRRLKKRFYKTDNNDDKLASFNYFYDKLINLLINNASIDKKGESKYNFFIHREPKDNMLYGGILIDWERKGNGFIGNPMYDLTQLCMDVKHNDAIGILNVYLEEMNNKGYNQEWLNEIKISFPFHLMLNCTMMIGTEYDRFKHSNQLIHLENIASYSERILVYLAGIKYANQEFFNFYKDLITESKKNL